MPKRTSTTALFVARLAAVLAVVACGGGVDGPVDVPVVVPPTLVPGTTQVFDAALGSALELAPSVILKDRYGNGIANVWIQWTPSSGKVENDSSRTDGSGRAHAGTWTLGTVSGMQTVTARVGEISVIAMTAMLHPVPWPP